MSTSRERLNAVLSNLDDGFVISPLTLSPVIPTGKHAVIAHLVNNAPVETGFGRFRDTTWAVAIVSPLTDPANAIPGLEDALDAVLDVLEAEPTLRWENAALEPYNERLWCFSVEVTIYNEIVPPVDFGAMTVKELRQYATDNDINLHGATVKADIISVLES